MKRGPYKGRIEQYKIAKSLRNKGYSFAKIAKTINTPLHTIAKWFPGREKLLHHNYPEKLYTNLKSKGSIRLRLIKERGHKCEGCKLTKWLGQPIMLEVHKHRIPTERKLLCPNCHAQTDDWRKKSGYGVMQPRKS